jgi:YidC/Oxa1 family membrane protein insertase
VLGALAAVAGVVLLTVAVRLLVMPLSFRAMRGQASQARIAPQVQSLRQRYGKQPERLQRELTALYAKEGTSVFAGFGPVLLQWPVFSVLYLLFRSASVAGGPNTLLSHTLLGMPLGGHWLSAGAGVLSVHGAVFAVVLAILAAVCWLSARVARQMTPSTSSTSSARPTLAPVPGAAASGALGVITRVLPYITVVIAAFAPLAAAIYLTVSTAWSVGERETFRRRDGAPR